MTMFHNLLGSESMQLKIVNLLSDRELLSGSHLLISISWAKQDIGGAISMHFTFEEEI